MLKKDQEGNETLIYTNFDAKEAKIPPSIKYIRPSSLINNGNLKSMFFAPDSKVESIKYGVIIESLEKLVIPKNLVDIDQMCFQLALKLVSVQVLKGNPKYITHNESLLKKSDNPKLYDILFCNRNIEEVLIHHAVKKIASYSFSYCNKITKFYFPKNASIETIEKYAFYSNLGIEKFVFPPSLKNVESFAFHGMKKLKSIAFLSENMKINLSCFTECENLQSITFPYAKKLFFEESLPNENVKIEVLSDVELNCDIMEQYKSCLVYSNNSAKSKNPSAPQEKQSLQQDYEIELQKLREENKKLRDLLSKQVPENKNLNAASPNDKSLSKSKSTSSENELKIQPSESENELKNQHSESENELKIQHSELENDSSKKIDQKPKIVVKASSGINSQQKPLSTVNSQTNKQVNNANNSAPKVSSNAAKNQQTKPKDANHQQNTNPGRNVPKKPAISASNSASKVDSNAANGQQQKSNVSKPSEPKQQQLPKKDPKKPGSGK